MKIKLSRYIFEVTIFPALAFICLLTLLISLGFWQLGRAEEKRALQKLNNASENEQPVSFSEEIPININGKRYRKVELNGYYNSAHQFLIDNQIANGKPGYYVMTPLQLAGSDKAVLVNRGWVPLNKDRSILPDISLNNTEEISLTGRINKFPSVGLKLKGSDIPTEGWPSVVQVIDKDILSERLGYSLLDFQIELDPDIANGFHRQWQQTRLLSPEKHTAYAMQWFALAVTLCGLFFWYSIKKEINE
jgi:surfeit locus 1 family protein